MRSRQSFTLSLPGAFHICCILPHRLASGEKKVKPRTIQRDVIQYQTVLLFSTCAVFPPLRLPMLQGSRFDVSRILETRRGTACRAPTPRLVPLFISI